MVIGRREFLFSAGLAPFVISSRAQADSVELAKGVPIVQTLTDETSAQFVVMIDSRNETRYRARSLAGRELQVVLTSRVAQPFDEGVAFDRLFVEGLRLGEEYVLEVHAGRSPVKIDERLFTALDTRPRASRFAIASCMVDVLDVFQGPMWKSLADTRPGYIFLVGDTCYADILTDGSARGFWSRHVRTRRTLDLFRWKKLVPVFATWDDHDYGKNNGDKNSPLRTQAYAAFKALWGWSPRGLAGEGPGVSSVLELCGQRFFLMDDRYFRDPRSTAKGKHWGDEQTDWMAKRLASSRAPAWIMNGSQFFAGYIGKESFESDHPHELAGVTKLLSGIDAPVVFGSGDVHYSEVMKIEKKKLGYETFELTSSSIHSATHPGMNDKKNPRRLKTTWRHNFMIVDSYPTLTGEIGFKTWAVGGNQRVHFEFEGRVRR